jgi:hypothetical protein
VWKRSGEAVFSASIASQGEVGGRRCGYLADGEEAQTEEEGEDILHVGVLLLETPQVEQQEAPHLRVEVLQQERKSLVRYP